MFILHFGKYFGSPVYSVPDDYLSQMLWFRGLTADVKEAVIRELKHRELWSVLQEAGEPFRVRRWKPKAMNTPVAATPVNSAESRRNVRTRKATESQ